MARSRLAAATEEMERAAEHKARVDRLKLAHKVHTMRVQGYTFVRIAMALGLTADKASSLHRTFLEYLRELDELGAVDEARRVQDERYETLLNRVWIDAMHGDMSAIARAQSILDSISAREARVTAMITKSDGKGTTMTLIAEGSTEDYIRSLRELGSPQ